MEPYPHTLEFSLLLLLVFTFHNKIFVKLKQMLLVSCCRRFCNSQLGLVVELTIYPAKQTWSWNWEGHTHWKWKCWKITHFLEHCKARGRGIHSLCFLHSLTAYSHLCDCLCNSELRSRKQGLRVQENQVPFASFIFFVFVIMKSV